ncbi:MAG: leucine-rich repeat protein [Salinivirgaceae bacterium]|nr:leucine-rich repeat protein [Salinivirgaceae bacterium]
MRRIRQLLLPTCNAEYTLANDGTTEVPASRNPYSHSILFRVLCLLCFLCYGLAAQAAQVWVNGVEYLINGKEAWVVKTNYSGSLYPTPEPYSGDIVIVSSVSYQSVYYPVTTIYKDAFKETNITSVTIPSSVKHIWNDAFYACKKLKTIYGELPDDIGDYAFSVCSELKSITIRSTERVNGVVHGLGARAFSSCSKLTTVNINSNNIDYFDEAFYNCNNITSVTTNCENIGQAYLYFTKDGIRYRVTDVDSVVVAPSTYSGNVTIPSSVTAGNTYYVKGIYDNAFSNCTNLTSVYIPNGVKKINNSAFNGCTSLTSVYIPNGVTSLGNNVFAGCTSLTSIYIPNSVTSMGTGVFSGCTKLSSATLSNNLTVIASNTFKNCSRLTSVTIPDGVTSIGSYAFYGCTKLASVNLPSGVIGISNYAFHSCIALKSINIPSGVISIGDYAFYGCTGLKSITIPDGVTSISTSAFEYCSSLTSVTIPNGVTSIGNRAFSSCDGLESITIPSNVTSIGSNAFEYSSLTSVTIPSKVTSIGKEAFYACSRLTSVSFERSTPPTFGTSVFYYTDCPIYVPSIAVVDAYKNAYNMSSYASRVTSLAATLTAVSNNNNYGTVSGGGNHTLNTTVAITATPAEDCYFVGWNDGDTCRTREITMTDNFSFTATFKHILKISNIEVADKTYDGTNRANVTFTSNAFESDNLTITCAANFSDPTVGNDKTVTYTFTISGADIANNVFADSLRTGSTTASITPKQLTINTTADSRKYDGTTSATGSISLAGVIYGETVTPNYTSVAFADKKVGTSKTVTFSGITLEGADSENYTLGGQTTATAYADITAKTLGIRNISAADKVYDGTTAASLSFNYADSLLAGDYVTVSATAQFESQNAGTQNVIYSFSKSGADAANYVFAEGAQSDTTTATITAKTVSNPKIVLSDYYLEYDGNAKTPTVTLKDGATVIPETEYGVEYTNNVEIGTATVTVVDSAGGNYTVSSCSTTFKIATPFIQITAENLSSFEGLTEDYIGFYAIGSSYSLRQFAQKVNTDGITDANAVLVADIVDNENVLDYQGNLNSGTFSTWTPIGSYTNKYTGTFDGNGHTISGLYMNGGGSYMGLFGYVGGATIRKVGVVDSYFRAYSYYIGGICGCAADSTIIENCFNAATILGTAGGNGMYDLCEYVGGICGSFGGTGSIKSCYNRGKISANNYVGGICGYASGDISYCVNIGNYSLEYTSYNIQKYSGNIYGFSQHSYYTNSYSSISSNSGEMGYWLNRKTSEGDLAWYQNIGVDPYPVLDSTHGRIYYQFQNYTNTWLTDEPEVVDGVYQITNADQLYWFAAVVNGINNSANGVLTADIVVNDSVLDANGNLNGNGSNFRIWTPIGKDWERKYNGTFNGNNHTVSGLYSDVRNISYAGLFGYVQDGTIKNVGVIKSYFKSNHVGGISGQGGTITNCYNTSTIVARYSDGHVGGICGFGGTQTGCYNLGKVSGSNNAGGICGIEGTQINSFYLEGCSSAENDNATSATAEEFASGKVTYWLNGGPNATDTAWYQTIGEDLLPVYDSTHSVVYASSPCHSEYSNEAVEKPHGLRDVFGKCPVCGEYLPLSPIANAAEADSNSLSADYVGWYAISNASDLYSFAQLVNNGASDAKAVLVADIVVNDSVLRADTLNGDGSNFYVWTPIGNTTYKYTGSFDGNGHTISGLYFNDETANYVGLFGYAIGATIRNVDVEDSYIRGSQYVGGICGYIVDYDATIKGTITNCSNKSTIIANNNVGGISGYSGTITKCHNTGSVSGFEYVGGICGNNGYITNCFNTGSVSGNYSAGGIIGYCFSSVVTGCFNTGSVFGQNYVGGICGNTYYYYYSSEYGTITNCYYLTGCARNSDDVEQLGSGTNNNRVEAKSFTAQELASGKVAYHLNGASEPAWYQTIGEDSLPVLDSTHGVVYMSSPCHISYSNTMVVKEHELDVHGRCSACGEYETPALVDGEYQIANAGQLYWFAAQVNAGNTTINGKLIADIVVNDLVLTVEGELNGPDSIFYAWTPIGTNSNRYAGKFNGNNHTVSGLYFRANSDYVGLFGCTNGAEISNVGVIDSYLRGKQYIGGICGMSYTSTFTKCFNTGTLMSDAENYYNDKYGEAAGSRQYIGGICGYGYNNTQIINCYNTGYVKYNTECAQYEGYIGGICGMRSGTTITGCYYQSGTVGRYGNGKGVGCDFKATPTSDVQSEIAVATASQFADGTVALAMNGGSNEGPWYQTVGLDASPVLDRLHGRVGKLITNGSVITVSGDWVLSEDYIVPEDKVLKIPADASVTTIDSAVITNNGIIVANGPISGNNLAGDGFFLFDTLTMSDIHLNAESFPYRGRAYTIGDGISYTINRTFCGKTFDYDGDDISTNYRISYQRNKDVTDNANVIWRKSDYSVTIIKRFSIIPRELTISNIAVEDKEYNGTTDATATFDVSGVIEGDSVTVSCNAAFADKNVGEGKAVSFGFTLGGTNAASYTVASPADSITAGITARTLTVTAQADSRVYDGTTEATGSVSASGIIDGDTVEVSYTAANFASKNVGTSIAVNFILDRSGVDAGNYCFAHDTVFTTANITPNTNVVVTITENSDSVVYNAAQQSVSGYTIDIFDALEEYAETDIAFDGDSVAVGTYTGTYQMALSADNFSNLNTNYDSVRFVIVDGTLTITKADGAPDMPQALMETHYISTQLVALPENWEWAETVALELGDNAVTALYAGADTGNYQTESIDITLTRLACLHNEGSDTLYTLAPTCTHQGYEGNQCCKLCGEIYEYGDSIPALGHAYDTVVIAPTCTAVGYTQLTCSRCGEVVNIDTVPANGHAAGEPVVENYVAPTCTEAGSVDTVIYCTVDTVELNREHFVLDATGHKADSIVFENVVAATCTTAGSKDSVVYCSVCGIEISRDTIVLPAFGHKPGEKVAINYVAPTITTEGSVDSVVYCTICGEILSSESFTIPVVDHEHIAGEPVVENYVAPTCTTAGSVDTVVYCTVNGELLSRTTYEIPATGHTADSIVIENVVEATCTIAGSYDSVVYCSVCGAEISRDTIVVPATGHTAGEPVVTYVAPTCTEPGYTDTTIYCTVDSTVIRNITVGVPALGHVYDTVTIAATCTEVGYKQATCSRCGDIVRFDTVPATGHIAGKAVIENYIVPTITTEGSGDSVVYCAICGEELSRVPFTLPVSDHEHIAGEPVVENYVAPTCTTAGSVDTVVYCTVKGELLSRATYVLPTLGHKADSIVIENVVAATFEAAGSYDSVVYCSVCGAEISRVTIAVPQLVKPVEAEVVEVAISKLEYTVGDSLKLDNGKLVIATSDSTTAEVVITPDMVKGFNPDSVGVQTVTVEFEVDGVLYTATFDVEVKAVEPVVAQSIKINALPAKVEYKQGEALDVTGGKITVIFSDNTTAEINLTADMVSGFDAETVGAQELTITYKADGVTLTATFSVEVVKTDDTDVDEVAALAVNIYAYGNTIVVENATEEIYVYDAMGALVDRVMGATTITVNGTGVYIVKTGNTSKRVFIQ